MWPALQPTYMKELDQLPLHIPLEFSFQSARSNMCPIETHRLHTIPCDLLSSATGINYDNAIVLTGFEAEDNTPTQKQLIIINVNALVYFIVRLLFRQIVHPFNEECRSSKTFISQVKHLNEGGSHPAQHEPPPFTFHDDFAFV